MRRRKGDEIRGTTGIAASLAALSLSAAGCALFVREAKRGFFLFQLETRRSDVRITLDRAFVEEYRNRTTIETSFTVDRAGRSAHPGYLDGDMHVAGRAREIGLPIVAEIANAASRPDAVEAVHRAAGAADPVRVIGAWRLWSEHFGREEQTQGETFPARPRTNPPHVFEVHPVTRFGEIDLLDSFHPVPGFRPEREAALFASLKSARLKIEPSEKSVALTTRRGELNDGDFTIEVGPDPPLVVPDGRFVTAAVVEPRGNRLADRIRMVFVKDTEPEVRARSLAPGDRLRVFGIPRIDLSAVEFRIEHAAEDPRLLDGNLPYEIIVIGIYPGLAAKE